ncbi:hypothetical protein [Fluviispira multicolorata]|uniref:Uncharacterized protein n=1 Tax=Fluviispira multicolorata TaxID=2654512 RepID=A0A833JB89_9BACT|nr:hypothetical protein [Fluviispira multicolorata]KAB8029074.1 hypothetical protein GCL57_11075 [Fluviispira multicolorata]
MESKFSALISNIKNINSASIVETIKRNQENLNPKAVLNFARKAVDSARSFSKEEINVLLGKANELGQKTGTEIEKIVVSAVKSILKGQPQEVATEEIRKEITNMLVEHNNGKNLLPIVKYVNNVLLNNAPTSIESFKNFRRNIGQTLIADAQKRIADRNIIDAQVIPEKKTQKKDRNKNRETD